MRFLFAFALLVFCATASAQTETPKLPLYKEFPTVPAFSLYRYPDSLKFNKEKLNNRVQTVVMVFSPDCSHCQAATTDLLKNMDKFKKTQILLSTSSPFSLIKPFYDVFHLDRYPNIVVAYDPSYMLGTFYNIHNFPSTFVYDKKGRFVKEFEGTISFEEIAKALD